MNEIDYNIRTAIPSDRSRLANLIHFGAYIHQHLDWKPPLDWIGSKPYLLAEREDDLFAAMACPPDLPDITWIRLFAIRSQFNVMHAWKFLWKAANEELSEIGKIRVAAISLQSWFNELLEESEFEHSDNVIVLMWETTTPLPKPATTSITIRPMMQEDLEIIEEIDHDAFGPVWKNSLESLGLAFQQSSVASVAERGNEIIGYQYSTSSSMGGHLARLAVKTSMQGKGIGYLLVHQVLSQFSKQGIRHVTVNTQEKNVASLALYSKAGFSITGEFYRVYLYNFNQ
jgi:ribosomal protein S18 acetylase RimI-like enzyme